MAELKYKKGQFVPYYREHYENELKFGIININKVAH